jgi:hypothetical protein
MSPRASSEMPMNDAIMNENFEDLMNNEGSRIWGRISEKTDEE